MASLWAGKPNRQVDPDPKPEKRYKASQSDWDTIHKHFEFHPCVSCGQRHESLHHAVPKSQRGADVIPNLVPLCGDGSRGCHGTLEAHSPGWERVAAAVRSWICTDPHRWAYVLGMLGEARFDKRYPSLTKRCERKPWCVSFAGHHGECLDLSDQAFQPRREHDEPPPVFWTEGV
jgi:hypothetical protein